MPITPVNGDLTAGMPGHYTETINQSPDPLVTGDVPALLLTDELVGPSKTIPAMTVVGFDTAGLLVPATYNVTPASAIKPIGILAYAVATTAGQTLAHAPVYRMGCFNPDRLIWDATFTTAALKYKAFEGSPSPTAIITRAPTSANY